MLLLRIWEKDSGPYMQSLHFAFGVGACISPLIAAPFLSSVGLSCNITDVASYNNSIISSTYPTHAQPMNKRAITYPGTEESNRTLSVNMTDISNSTNRYLNSSQVENTTASTPITTFTSGTTLITTTAQSVGKKTLHRRQNFSKHRSCRC